MSDDEITIEHDQLIDNLLARLREEHARSSDASESAAKVKEFLEDTRLNAKAYGFLKQILKQLPKKDGQSKAMDVIRSLELALPMVRNHVESQGNVEMDLGEPAEMVGDDLDEIEQESAEFDEAVEGLDDDNVVSAFGA